MDDDKVDHNISFSSNKFQVLTTAYYGDGYNQNRGRSRNQQWVKMTSNCKVLGIRVEKKNRGRTSHSQSCRGSSVNKI